LIFLMETSVFLQHTKLQKLPPERYEKEKSHVN